MPPAEDPSTGDPYAENGYPRVGASETMPSWRRCFDGKWPSSARSLPADMGRRSSRGGMSATGAAATYSRVIAEAAAAPRTPDSRPPALLDIRRGGEPSTASDGTKGAGRLRRPS